jgi:osmotically inducible protein OsmC
MAVDRSATTVWTGDLQSGKGALTLDSSKAGGTFDVDAPSRFEAPEGQTSPEELIAAAHSACFSMALSMTLSQNGNPPEEINTSATCTIDKQGEGFKITTMRLQVRARVPGIEQEAFDKAIEATEAGCPVSNALRGNVEQQVEAQLV